MTNGQVSPSLTEITIELLLLLWGIYTPVGSELILRNHWLHELEGRPCGVAKSSQTSTSTQANQEPLKKCRSKVSRSEAWFEMLQF